eukprot:669515-Hanusia_phi.AAC.1
MGSRLTLNNSSRPIRTQLAGNRQLNSTQPLLRPFYWSVQHLVRSAWPGVAAPPTASPASPRLHH